MLKISPVIAQQLVKQKILNRQPDTEEHKTFELLSIKNPGGTSMINSMIQCN